MERQQDREYIVQQNLDNTLALLSGSGKYLEPSDGPAIEYWTRIELGNAPEAQLYDLKTDPCERHDVAAEHPEIVERLTAKLETVKQGATD